MAPTLATTFARWGTSPRPVGLSGPAEAFLLQELGAPQPRPAVALADVAPAPSRLDAGQLAGLGAAAGGADRVSTTTGDRIGHAAGCSLTDYLTLRQGRADTAPDAVVRPTDHDGVRDLLSFCSNHGLPVVPFGGGTSVVGGVTRPDDGRAWVSLALDAMTEVLAIDETSLTATVQPGITGPVLERILATRGLTWGHLPQSWERATVGGYIATRSAGQSSTGYGRSDETVESLRVATPLGELSLGRAPHSAAGPDLRQLFIGSEGALGVITELTLRLRRLPTATRYEGLMFRDYQSGIAAFRELAQARLTAEVMRLSDVPETTATLSMSGPQGRAKELLDRYLDMRRVTGGCMAILGWEEYSGAAMAARRKAAWKILSRHGAATLGNGVGGSWKKHRFDGPYLRDELLDRGYIVETLETATHWHDIGRLHDAVRDALLGALSHDGERPYVMSHVSHVYETGCSLYFTVIVPAQADPIAQWAGAKRAATDAIMANTGTVTHHHAVGRDHAPWLEQEIGLEGLRVLRAVKAAVDPEGILNPGVLLS